MHRSGAVSPLLARPTGGVVKTANASPRTRTVWRSSGGVRGSDRRKATKRSLAEGNGNDMPRRMPREGESEGLREGATGNCAGQLGDRRANRTFAIRYAMDRRGGRGKSES